MHVQKGVPTTEPRLERSQGAQGGARQEPARGCQRHSPTLAGGPDQHQRRLFGAPKNCTTAPEGADDAVDTAAYIHGFAFVTHCNRKVERRRVSPARGRTLWGGERDKIPVYRQTYTTARELTRAPNSENVESLWAQDPPAHEKTSAHKEFQCESLTLRIAERKSCSHILTRV